MAVAEGYSTAQKKPKPKGPRNAFTMFLDLHLKRTRALILREAKNLQKGELIKRVHARLKQRWTSLGAEEKGLFKQLAALERKPW
jgi:hypothetical protein